MEETESKKWQSGDIYVPWLSLFDSEAGDR